MKKIMYLSVGFILIAAVLITGRKELSERTRTNYQYALKIEKEVGKEVWSNLSCRDYPVAFRSGEKEYVIYQGETTKRAPVLLSYAGTASEVDGQINVFLPAIEEFNQVLSSVEGDSNAVMEQFGYGTDTLSDEDYVASIYHETFHAYQQTYYKAGIEKLIQGQDNIFDNMQLIPESIDKNGKIKLLYEKQLKILQQAIMADSLDTAKEYIIEYYKSEEERRKIASDTENLLIAEDYYQTIEGGARYVEAQVYRLIKGEKAYQDKYISTISKYMEGTEKYYRIGMGFCILLDQFYPEWKSEIDFSLPYHKVLKNYLDR